MQEGMLPYVIATNQYNFPVLIVPVLVLYLRLSTKVNTSTLPVPVQLTDITLGYPAANTSSTKKWVIMVIVC